MGKCMGQHSCPQGAQETAAHETEDAVESLGKVGSKKGPVSTVPRADSAGSQRGRLPSGPSGDKEVGEEPRGTEGCGAGGALEAGWSEQGVKGAETRGVAVCRLCTVPWG